MFGKLKHKAAVQGREKVVRSHLFVKGKAYAIAYGHLEKRLRETAVSGGGRREDLAIVHARPHKVIYRQKRAHIRRCVIIAIGWRDEGKLAAAALKLRRNDVV